MDLLGTAPNSSRRLWNERLYKIAMLGAVGGCLNLAVHSGISGINFVTALAGAVVHRSGNIQSSLLEYCLTRNFSNIGRGLISGLWPSAITIASYVGQKNFLKTLPKSTIVLPFHHDPNLLIREN